MAKTLAGGTQVTRGYYVDARSFEFVNVAKDGTALPGGPERKYVRIPTVVAMAAAPALGGLFVIALPFISVGMVAYAIAKRFRSGAKEVAATAMGPTMPAGSTALTGSATEEKGAEAIADRNLDALAKEIREKRAK